MDSDTNKQPAWSRTRRPRSRLLRLFIILAAFVLLFRLTGCMERLFYQPTVGPTPVPANLPGAELIAFNSRDGTRLCGWFIPAHVNAAANADRARESVPTILHVHGNAGNITDHAWFTEYLPAAGLSIFIFDYRGYGQSEGIARSRESLIDDTNAALDCLLSRSDIDSKRIGMYGQSLGGAIGLNVMAERPEIRAAVIESAFSSWRDEAANALGGESPGAWARALAWMLIPDGRRVDDAIARCGPRPILILHGTADTTVYPSHGRRLKAAGDEHVALIEFPGGTHNSLRESHPEVEGIIAAFFHDHLTD
jgi:dipeptidyl aminopeptidase/acylaminoacyl peptidase